MVLYNVLETISIFSFAQQMMLREFGVFKGLALLQPCAKSFLLICAKNFDFELGDLKGLALL